MRQKITKNYKAYLVILCLFVLSPSLSWGQCNPYIAISNGFQHGLALKSDSTLWSWGDNTEGQLGVGTNTSNTTATQVVSSVKYRSIATSSNQSFAIRADGTLWAWGENGGAQLGDGTNTDRNSPVQISTANNWSMISPGFSHTLSIKNDGTLWAWGLNPAGQLGNGTNTGSNVPIQIGTATDWAMVAAGTFHSIAIKTNGTLWSWGHNGDGQLGDGTNTARNSPVQIGTAADWKDISTRGTHNLALKTDGTLWSWGYNSSGQLGNGTTTNSNVPVQIGTASWQLISAGFTHSMAIQNNGTLWAWGNNYLGRLGDGTSTDKSSPVQIGTASDWSIIELGNDHSMAIANDQTYAWGDNSGGRYGNGTTTVSLVPLAVGPTPPALVNGGSITATSCGPYASSSGKIFTSSGTHLDTLKYAAGCDSAYRSINLTVNPLVVSTFVGSGSQGSTNGSGAAASFNSPSGISMDAAGNIYVADQFNNIIRKITSAGVVSTLAGSGSIGSADGTGTAASFFSPADVAVDNNGNVYVADFGNNKIRKISPSGVVTTLAGSGTTGAANGTGAAASFDKPTGLAVDGNGNVYVADRDNHLIRKISPSGVVTTLAGSGSLGSADGTGATASFNGPFGVSVDGNDNVYVADFGNNKIRKITSGGVVTTIAGSGSTGSVDGIGASASFKFPSKVFVDGNGNVYVSDFSNHKIRKISPTGVVSTLAGTGTPGATEGMASMASFNLPSGITVDGSGNIFVSDLSNNKIRKIICCLPAVTSTISATECGSYFSPSGKYTWTTSGTYLDTLKSSAGCDSAYLAINLTINPVVVSTFAGSGNAGSTNGSSTIASFNKPIGIAVDGNGNLYVGDNTNHKIRRITSNGVVTTLAGSGSQGSVDAQGANASFNAPQGVDVDGNGNIYVADMLNQKIRKISSSGTVTTLAGNGSIGSTDGPGASASFNYPTDVAVDGNGNVYVADGNNRKIRKITPAGVVSTLAGSGSIGSTDGPGVNASFISPNGVAVDGNGNVYVSDLNSYKIRKISPSGVVSTLAGNGSLGSVDGPGASASFIYPTDIDVDGNGNLYVTSGEKIRKINSSGVVSTFAGSGNTGSSDGPSAIATFDFPSGVTVDGSGNVYVADRDNNKIRKINCCPPGVASTISATGCGSYSSPSGKYAWTSNGTYMDTLKSSAGCDSVYLTINLTVNPVAVSTFAGSGSQGSTNGTGTAASFNYPSSVEVDGSGNLYIADASNHSIRKITPAGVVTTLAGSGSAGSMNGQGGNASFYIPNGVAVDGIGNVFVADYGNQKIRKISPSGVVTTFAGSGSAGSTDGLGTNASFNGPGAVAVDNSGNVYVADFVNNKIRKISPGGMVSTLAGSGSQGSVDGQGTSASFKFPYGITVDGSGNVYVADYGNHKIRKIAPGGMVSTLAGSGIEGATDGLGTNASFDSPRDISVDGNGNVYVADRDNHKIRKISPGGMVITLAGSGSSGFANGPGISASFNEPDGVAIDGSGNVYVADLENHRIRKISCCPSGVASTISATGCGSYSSPSGKYAWTSNGTYMDTLKSSAGCDSAYLTINVTINPVAVSTHTGSTSGFVNGPLNTATFNKPSGAVVDGAGNMYVVDALNHSIRKIDASGTVTTLAGNGTAGFANGNGTAAQFNFPRRIAVDVSGNLYVTDESNNRIRKIDGSGNVTTLAGNGTAGFVNGPGNMAQFDHPIGIAVDAVGNIYVADLLNSRIRKIDASGNVSTLAGSGTSGFANGVGVAAQFRGPYDVAVDASGNVYVADRDDNRIRKIDASANVTTLAGSGTSGSVNGVGTAAQFNGPVGITVDGVGDVYVSEESAHLVRKISSGGVVTTFAGSGTSGSTNGSASAAQFAFLDGVTTNGNGTVYVADGGNSRIRKINCCQTTTATISPVVCGTGPYTSPSNKTFATTGTYMDTIQNAQGCDSILTINLTISNPSVSVTPNVTSHCIGGVANLVATGTSTYSWMPGGSTNDTLGVSTTSNTVYTVTGTDAHNCTAMATATVNSTFPSSNIAQTNGAGTTSVAGTKCDTFYHPNAVSQYYDFFDASCNKIASIFETGGGAGLGVVRGCVTVESSTPMHNGQPYISRWFEVVPENNNIPSDLIFYLTDNDVITYNANNGSYPDLPTNAGSATVIPTSMLHITKTNGVFGSSTPTVIVPDSIVWNSTESVWQVRFSVTSFSQFRLHGANPGNAALPIVLKDFTVEKAGSTDLIKWTTSSEYNNKYFEVERSSNGIDFRNLGRINTQATNGLSNTELSYQYIDHAPEVGHNYYRLKQVDFDGNYTYTEVVDIVWGAAGSTVSIYPNPVSDVLNVDLSTNKILNAEIRLLDMSGRVIKSVLAKTSNGLNHVTIALNDIAAGVYGVQIYENNKLTHVQKIRKNH